MYKSVAQMESLVMSLHNFTNDLIEHIDSIKKENSKNLKEQMASGNKIYKKVTIIEAIKYTGHNDHEITEWSKGLVYASPVLEPTSDNPMGAYLQFKESYQTAIVGDWIVKDLEGNFTVKNDVFMQEYDI